MPYRDGRRSDASPGRRHSPLRPSPTRRPRFVGSRGPDSEVLQAAADVIARSSRDHPADAVLRQTFRGASLPREQSREATHLVFAYFRWMKWLNNSISIQGRLRQALALAESFKQDPSRFGERDLLTRSIPSWLSKHFEVTAAWTRALQSEPRLWLRCKPGQARILREKLRCISPDLPSMPDTLEHVGTEDLFTTAEFRNGDFEIQDLHSQAVSLVCAPHAGEKWWDACAGEGGKTLHLSSLMHNSGLIWASDKADWRLKRLVRRTARAKVFNYRAVKWDGSSRLPTRTMFDGVLVDAPCTGVGTWQRNPHARWTARPEDVQELARIQQALLANASNAVKPGGKLVYSVCTLPEAETEQIADFFNNNVPGFEPLALTNPLAPKDPASPTLLLRTEKTGGNGMFIAGWIRK